MHSKLTLYDFLCIFIFGWLILFPFIGCIGDEPKMQVAIFIFPYIVGLIFHRCIEGIFMICKIKKYLSRLEKKAKNSALKRFLTETKTATIDRKVMYIEAYYYLIKNNYLNVIPVLEAQVGFLRNLLFLPFYYIVIIYINKQNIFTFCYCNDLLIICILTILIIIAWRLLQYKIFKLVWESYYYNQYLESKEHEKKNI